MSTVRTKSRGKKRIQKLKIKWEQLGLLEPNKEKDMLPIEEVRRQVAFVASRGLTK